VPDLYGNYIRESSYLTSDKSWSGGGLVNLWTYGFDDDNGIMQAHEIAIKNAQDILVYVRRGADPFHSSSVTDNLRSLIDSGGIDAAGNRYTNYLTGGDIGDTLRGVGGNDRLKGGGGNDLLVGGPGKDDQWGGRGSDVFHFRNSGETSTKFSGRDIIHDFGRPDYIDLHFIDASTLHHGNNAFAFIGSARFDGHAGELRYSGGVVTGDVNGDKHADFSIEIANDYALHSYDFML
jgi:Ca2+-binding RTX toxin-like protein